MLSIVTLLKYLNSHTAINKKKLPKNKQTSFLFILYLI